MLLCLETLVGHVMFLKGLIAAVSESSELLQLNGMSEPSQHRESKIYTL